MSEKQFNPENKKSSQGAEKFKKFLEKRGEPDYLEQKVLETWQTHGAESARSYYINDADKFGQVNKEVIAFLERELFGAGEDGLAKKTPWNTFRRKKAGLPILHSFED
ncbi:MAG: hypothetical protein NTX82_06380 [Candidatus Parcubacteria bacterium]|nr:hypothetical protein [Candidatus Parcubacteria bacterium]